MLKSRFSFHGEHIGALFLAFFAIGGLLKLIVDPYDTKGNESGVFYVFVLILIWVVLIYAVYLILKIPKIIISDDTIIFKTVFSAKQLPLSDIDSVGLTGKRSSSFMRNDEEVCTLILKNDEKIFIRVECYKNSSEIRQVLERVNTLRLKNKPDRINNDELIIEQRNKIQKPVFSEETIVKYSGNPYLNFKALLVYGFCIGLIIATRSPIKLHPERLPILLIPIIAFYLGFGFQLHYFFLSDRQLVIKNAFWFWKKHVYQIDELLEVVFETPRKTSNSIRVITKNFKTKLYPAGGLKMEHWKEFKRHLESLRIRTRDETGI